VSSDSVNIRTIRPGLLVSVHARQSGNRSYQKRDIERAHLTESGTERSSWATTRIVFDPAEAKTASQVANRARYLITRLCADTAHGPLCPLNRRDELKEAIAEARALVADFNDKAVFSRVEINVICGEVVADDVEAARALFSETEKFLAQAQDGLKELDVKKVRAACQKLLDIGQMLSPEANTNVAAAVNTARAAARKIVAAGEQAAIEIDQQAIAKIGVARSSFLDFGMSNDEVVIEHERFGRALDFDSPAPVETAPRPQVASMDLDFEDAI
jgi:hypothetical protein